MSASSRRAPIVAVLAIALAGCTAAISSLAPAASGPGASSPATPIDSSGASSSPLAGQTDTDWGRIWDSLPDSFPRYPGAAPAEGATSGPASAVLAVQGVEPKTIADWIESKLKAATYRTEALSGPLEDGSFVLDSNGSAPGCRVQVSVAPLGGLTVVTVRYGASCPAL